ncbi:late competence protein ComER [Paenibacillus camelliae]|uniref:late competence protein ComER n=1 Tax=Paenibacillus camelliae TaxID=512410 RepID=UPI002041A4C2|nr:late competence protein ComER [Paenibacillus camelliae]MCM3635468.1 late competence protein ComER [Paenibacillus camelliae]
MNIGFIGAGSMGSLLIEAFIIAEAVEPNQISVSNRTYSKVEQLACKFPGLQAKQTNTAVVQQADIVFLCIKPHEFAHVISEIKPFVRDEQLIVSITSPVQLSHLEQELNCHIAKIIPSITNKMWSGATLCIYSEQIDEAHQTMLEQLLAYISEPIRIEESYTRIVSDISSCGPAFMSFFLQQFVDAAVEETGISRDAAMMIASNMMLGTGLLLTEGGMTPEEVQRRVAVPGGITAKALAMLKKDSTGLFNSLIRTTHAKYFEDVEVVSAQFKKEEVREQ